LYVKQLIAGAYGQETTNKALSTKNRKFIRKMFYSLLSYGNLSHFLYLTIKGYRTTNFNRTIKTLP